MKPFENSDQVLITICPLLFKLKEALTGDSGTILLTTPPPDIFNSRQILRKERNDAHQITRIEAIYRSRSSLLALTIWQSNTILRGIANRIAV